MAGGVRIPVVALVLFAACFALLFPVHTEIWRENVRTPARNYLKETQVGNFINYKKFWQFLSVGVPFFPATIAALLSTTLAKGNALSKTVRLPVTGFQLVVTAWVVLQAGVVLGRTLRDADPKITAAFSAVLNMQLLFLPISRTSPLLHWLKVDPAEVLEYHRLLGWTALYGAVIHGVWYVIFWFQEGGMEMVWMKLFEWKKTDKIPILPGTICLVVQLILSVTSIPWFRRRFYNIFFQTHRVTAALFLVFFATHYPGGVWWMVANYLIHLADRATEMRAWVKPVPILSARYRAGVLSIKLPCAVPAQPQQWVQLQAPGLSQIEQHPFTVADARHDSFKICIKVIPGSWTERLANDIMDRGVSQKTLRVSDFYSATYDPEDMPFAPLFMIAGGSGITTYMGLMDFVSHAQEGKGWEAPILLAWVCRSKAEMKEYMRHVDLHMIASHCPSLQVKFYLTQSQEDSEEVADTRDFGQASVLRPPRVILEWLCTFLVPLGAVLMGGRATLSEERFLHGTYVWVMVLAGASLGAILAHALASVVAQFFHKPSIREVELTDHGANGPLVPNQKSVVHDPERNDNVSSHSGRPDVKSLLTDFEKRCKGESIPLRIFASGPPSLNSDVQAIAIEHGYEYDNFTYDM